MQEEIIDIDPIYKKGFNEGYILAKERPESFDQLMKSKNDHSQYFQGIKAGGKEYLKEKFKEELQRNREEKNTDREKDKDRS